MRIVSSKTSHLFLLLSVAVFVLLPVPPLAFTAIAAEPASLQEALSSHTWLFHDHGDKDHFECRFKSDGSISPGKMHWSITGPYTAKIWWTAPGNIADLTFNQTFSSFTGKARDPVKMPHGYLRGERLDANGVAAQPGQNKAATEVSPSKLPASPKGVPWIAVFAGELSRASEWAVLPLTTPVPVSIRDNVVSLDEGLKVEAFKTPQASKDAYASAHEICRVLTVALDDREKTMRGVRQAGAFGNLSEYGNLSASWTSPWEERSAKYRAAIRAEYTRFSDAVMKSEQPKLPPEPGMIASVSFPPVPGPAREPAPQPNPRQDGNTGKPASSNLDLGSKGGLNRGAYDHHYIWRGWWGPVYRIY